MAKSANPARRCRGPKPTPNDREPSTATQGRHFRERVPTCRSGPRKLIRLGEARTQRRSVESPRHRSARAPNTEALDTSRSLSSRLAWPPKRPTCACPRGGILNVCRRRRRSDSSDIRRSPTCRRSSASTYRTLSPPKRKARSATPPRNRRSDPGSLKRAEPDDEAPTDPKADQLPRSLPAEAIRSRGEPA